MSPLIATTLIVLGIILGIADRLAAQDGRNGRGKRARPRKTLEELNVKDGLLYGCAQALALVPGVSRSGATISGGLFMGYTREAAARYSFLLAIPAVMASGCLELTEIGEGSHVSWGPTIFATLLAFAVAYAVIAWFMRYISTRSFMPFVIYRVILGVVIFVLVATGVLTPNEGANSGGVSSG